MNEIKYGIMSDIHEDPRVVSNAISVLKKLGANKLILNGDIGIHSNSINTAQDHTAIILDSIGKSGLESYVQTGSHEITFAHEPVLASFTNKYSNIIDVFKHPKIDMNSHHLVFLPGSDVNAGGEYTFGGADIPTGTYFKTLEGQIIPLVDMDVAMEFSNAGQLGGLIHYNNMSDLRNYVSHPDKTIVICHVPRRFDNFTTGIDVAHFIDQYDVNTRMVMFKDDPENRDKFISYSGLVPVNIPMAKSMLESDTAMRYNGKHVTEDDIISFATKYASKNSEELIRVYVERNENRGNEDLKNLYDELGIRKAVSGHFHESSHRAHDSNGIIVPQNTFVNDLFWNSGHLDKGLTGILTVNGNNVSYQNIDLNTYKN